jgi:hypothetical protein
MTEKLYQVIANALMALTNATTKEWKQNWNDRLDQIERDLLPNGSGFDTRPKIHRQLYNRSKDTFKIDFEFHHMNDIGMYDGWTIHTISVKADLINELHCTINGPNKRGCKEYFYDVYQVALTKTVTWVDTLEKYIEVQNFGPVCKHDMETLQKRLDNKAPTFIKMDELNTLEYGSAGTTPAPGQAVTQAIIKALDEVMEQAQDIIPLPNNEIFESVSHIRQTLNRWLVYGKPAFTVMEMDQKQEIERVKKVTYEQSENRIQGQ